MKYLGQIVELFVKKTSFEGKISMALIKTKHSIRILKIDFPEHMLKKTKRNK
jgi:hypothetical protein